MKYGLVLCLLLAVTPLLYGQSTASSPASDATPTDYFAPVKWRNIGPYRGGRSVAVSGVVGDPITYYMGTTGGGLWRTKDAGQHWHNISDGYFRTGSVGAVAVAPSDPNVLYVGMGEHAPRGVMTSYGDGVYRSTDAGKTWQHAGLERTRQIAGVQIDPRQPDIVYVAAQGSLNGPSAERGVYKSSDGGRTWRNTLFVDENTGCAHLVMDPNNSRILYAAMWDHRRLPWQVISGGPGSGLYKSTDSGETWHKIHNGLPDELGKISVSVSGANPEKVYALIESDSDAEKGGLFVSNDGGGQWSRVSKDHRLVQRAWYYLEVFADPVEEHTVYVLNSPVLKSIDGGQTWQQLGGTHSDQHHLWINPLNNRNLVVANDGGAAISFDGGLNWSTQDNMPTAQFYRVNVDNAFPYRIYGGQQDNTSVRIANRRPAGRGLTERDWSYSAGGESAFLAFDPDNPRYVLGGSYQGTIEVLDSETDEGRKIMAAPHQYLAMDAKDMRYRFNWNAPIIWSRHEPNTFYHGANVLLKTTDRGVSWTEVSPDLTRNEIAKQGKGGAPYTNEGAGGENYGTLSYVVESPHTAGVIWTGSDDGLVHLTRDGGKTWTNVTPAGLAECLVNAIEVSPHDPATAYLATTRYKLNDLRPGLYKTTDYGRNWTAINGNIPDGSYTRVVREDPVRRNLLFAGTETGLYASFDGGRNWQAWQLNLPVVPITDLIIRHDDLIAATQGRAFWVLDDLELIRQYDPAIADLHLYRPADVIRVSGRSELDRNDAKFTGSTVDHGVNPASGAVLYYALPPSTDSMDLELAILNADGEIVRNFSSQKNPSFVDYPGGPSADPLLGTQAGLNRFVWDLRTPTLLGAPRAYLEGSYRGQRVPPGDYTIRLTQGETTRETTLTVLPRPDLDAPPSDYQAQYELQQQVAESINEIHGTVNTLQDIRGRIDALTTRLVGSEPLRPLADRGKGLLQRIDTWDGQLIQRKSQVYDDVINFPNGLTADYLFLKGQMDTNAPVVTAAMRERFQELRAKWLPLRSQYRDLRTDIERFEAALRAAGVGLLLDAARP